jgi:hypothetical protein
LPWLDCFARHATDPDQENAVSRLDKLRARQGLPPRQPGPAPTQPAAPPPEPARAPERPVPKPAPGAPVFSCGHALNVRELAGQACAACRNKARQEKAARKRAARGAKPPKDAAGVGRLPDGSAKLLRWYAARGLWVGVLDVPGCPPFTAEATGEKGCYHALDRAYREWLAAQPAP